MLANNIERLSESGERRTVDRRRTGQIELCWDWTVICLRTVDLRVLDNALRAWMDDPEREWAETYGIILNGSTLFIADDQMAQFCAMIHAAVEQLPRRIIRWADLDVQIVPFAMQHHRQFPNVALN